MGGGPAACALVELAPLLCHCLGRSRLSNKKNYIHHQSLSSYMIHSSVHKQRREESARQPEQQQKTEVYISYRLLGCGAALHEQ
jgi:hypothetical protein